MTNACDKLLKSVLKEIEYSLIEVKLRIYEGILVSFIEPWLIELREQIKYFS
jgi:hypothetical protein